MRGATKEDQRSGARLIKLCRALRLRSGQALRRSIFSNRYPGLTPWATYFPASGGGAQVYIPPCGLACRKN